MIPIMLRELAEGASRWQRSKACSHEMFMPAGEFCYFRPACAAHDRVYDALEAHRTNGKKTMNRWHVNTSIHAALLSLALCISTAAIAQDSRVEEARKLDEKARQLYEEGKYSEGLPIAKQALEIWEKESAEHPGMATALRTIANLHRSMGAYAEAKPLLERALAIQEKALGAEHLDTAITLNVLAILYQNSGSYAKAEPLYQKAIAIREKQLGPGHELTARFIANLATLYAETGALAKAESLYQRVIRIKEKTVGPNHISTAHSIANLAFLYVRMGDDARAESLYRRALDVQRQVHGENHPSVARSLSSLGVVYTNTGAYSEAERVLQQALAFSDKALGTESPLNADVLSNLANLYDVKGEPAKAELLCLRSLAIREKVLGPDHPSTALSLYNLGRMYADGGSHARAETPLHRALEIREAVLGPDHPATAASLEALARMYRMSSDYAKAEPLQRRALVAYEKMLGAEHRDTAKSIEELALLHWALGQPLKALPLMQRVHKINARNDERFLLSGSDSRKRDYVRLQSENVSINTTAALSFGSQEGISLGLMSALQHKGRALDAATGAVSRLRTSMRPEHRALFTALADVASQLSMLTYQEDIPSPESYQQHWADLSRRQDELEARLAEQSAEFRQQTTMVTPARVQAVVPSDAALIEWVRYSAFNPKASSTKEQWGQPRYMAYVVRRTGSPVAVDLGIAQDVEVPLLEFRAAVSDPERSDIRRSATALYERLIEPLQVHLSGVRQLLVSPDGALNLVPMSALVDRRGRYLVETFEITHVTSGRDLLRVATPKTAASSNPVIMADPDYGPTAAAALQPSAQSRRQQRSAEFDRGGMVFRSLPGTALEARAITALLKNASTRLLTRQQATEENLKQVRSPRILHLATHGFFLKDQSANTLQWNGTNALAGSLLTENPLLRSGLALAGANARRSGVKEDGILTALEASRLDLRGTQLVVLSACETALGEELNGDGITGLRRGLMLAGAQTQISSLWKVPDLPTKELMVSFYQHLAKREGRSAALRQAQLEMLAISRQAHPYYWASFVATGDWTPLPTL